MNSLKEYTREEWLKSWEEGGHTRWHQSDVDQILKTHFPVLLERLGGRGKALRILVPFCGKTVDILWLAEAGHKVVGVDISERAVKDFFTDNHLSYEQVQVGKLVQYKCANIGKDVEMWQGDFYECSSNNIGTFDAVWDRGGLGSVAVKDRQRYVDLILSVLEPKGAVLMHTFEYNQEERLAVPYSISGQTLQKHWGHACSLQLMETIDELKRNPYIGERYGFSRYNILAHIIQKN